VRAPLLLLLLAACRNTALPIAEVVRDPYAPRPFQFRFSPDGREVAYLLERERNGPADLWSVEVATGARRLRVEGGEALLSPEERAARERLRQRHEGISAFAWSPKGGSILLPLGGDLYRLDGETLTRLTGTAAPELCPAFSPDGESIAYVRDGNLHVLRGTERALTTEGAGKIRCGLAEFIAMEELGRHEGFWWSPDSTRIAYVRTDSSAVPLHILSDPRSERGGGEPQEYPRAGDPNVLWKVGVVPASGGATVWLPVKDEYLSRVQWTPDGRLLLQTLDRLQKRRSFWRCDPGTGAAELLFDHRDEAWVEGNDDTRSFADGSMIWSADGTLFERRGGKAREIGAGIDGLLEADDESVWFRRDGRLFRLERGTGKEEDRTPAEPGWHEILLSPDRRSMVDTWSRAGQPPRTVLRTTWGAFPFSDPKPRAHLRPRFFRIDAGGVALDAMLLRSSVAGRRPAIVHVYGGPGSRLVADRWGGVTYLFHERLARLGFSILTVDNRGCGGRGRDFSRTVAGRLCGPETEDQAAGARWLAEQGFVDAERIGVWGWSYGGTMALHCLLRHSRIFRAGVAVAPVTDWRDYDTAYTERYLGLPPGKDDAYARASPLTMARMLGRPLLLAHGFLDDNVHFRHAALFLDATMQAGRDIETDFYPRGAHGIGGPAERELLFTRIEAFFRRELG
jgi:dipeptidyl-peptidase-4